MSSVLIISDKSVFEKVISWIRTPTPMIRFAPTCPSGVTNATIFSRMNHTITTMELSGRCYVVITSGSINPSPIMSEIKKTAERMGGYWQELHGVEANEILAVAQRVT